MLDILAIAAHPDDVELACSGTLLAHQALGYTIGILDLTRGELGTRGSADIRRVEAQAAAEILKLNYRHNICLPDGFFEIRQAHLMPIIEQIRLTKPKIVLANALSDRHPDHGRAAKLVADACFYAGLTRIVTHFEGIKQLAHRPNQVFHYIQDNYIKPDFLVDITPYFETKMAAIKAYKTQFFSDSNEQTAQTPISSKDFLNFLEARAREMGRPAQVTYAEGFVAAKPPVITNLLQLL